MRNDEGMPFAFGCMILIVTVLAASIFVRWAVNSTINQNYPGSRLEKAVHKIDRWLDE